MAVCWVCEREMLDQRVIGCDPGARREQVPMLRDGREHEPALFRPELLVERCRDCGALKGQLHHFGRVLERCPVCDGQFISCGCFDEAFDHLAEGEDDED